MNFENICTQKEAEFLLANLKPTDNVLEYGSGEIALQIASKVKHISVITHDLKQYGNIIDNKPNNVEALMVPTNIPQQSDDGTFAEFENYIKAGEELSHRFGKFLVIIIRGRARVECAKFVQHIAKLDCKIFIQDYNHPNEQYRRTEYFEAENYLTKLRGEFTMYLFEVKERTPEQEIVSQVLKNAPETKYIDDSKERWAAQPPTSKPRTKKITELPKAEQKRVKEVAKKISKQK